MIHFLRCLLRRAMTISECLLNCLSQRSQFGFLIFCAVIAAASAFGQTAITKSFKKEDA